MKEITSFCAAGPDVWRVNAVPLVFTSFAWALAVVASLMAQKYELAEMNAAELLKVTVLGPFVFGIVNVPVTACCAAWTVPPVSKTGTTPAAPVGPTAPVAPGEPLGPEGPFGPEGPEGPEGPFGPEGPDEPCGPCLPLRAWIALFVNLFSGIEWFLIDLPEIDFPARAAPPPRATNSASRAMIIVGFFHLFNSASSDWTSRGPT